MYTTNSCRICDRSPAAATTRADDPTTNNDGEIVDALAEKPDARLREWKADTAEARTRITEVIELADCDVLDINRSPNWRSSTCWMSPGG